LRVTQKKTGQKEVIVETGESAQNVISEELT
jgi:hypothetical protein